MNIKLLSGALGAEIHGIDLKKICQAKLKKVELQIKKIKIENNKIVKEDFE